MARRVAAVAMAMAAVLTLALGGGAAWAAGPAGPFSPVKAGQFQVGLEGSWLLAEKLKDATESFRFSTGESGQRTARDMAVKNDRLYQVRLAYGLTDWLNLHVAVGRAEAGHIQETLGRNQWEAMLKPVLVWALGGQARIFEQPNGLGLALGAQYLRYDDRGIGQWRYPDGSVTSDYGTTVDAHVDYWRLEANATLYWRLGRLTPYVGAGYAHSEIKLDERWSSPGEWSAYGWDTRNQDNLNLLVGLAVELRPNLSLDLRGNFLSREEVMLGVSWGF